MAPAVVLGECKGGFPPELRDFPFTINKASMLCMIINELWNGQRWGTGITGMVFTS
jgi:hypothetical protein